MALGKSDFNPGFLRKVPVPGKRGSHLCRMHL